MAWKIPSTLWAQKTLRVPPVLLAAYREVAQQRGWAMTEGSREQFVGAIGGPEESDARAHFEGRFFTSSIRTQFVMCDPWKKSPELVSLLLERLGEGQLTLLDLAAGHGAGALGMIATLHEARISKALPSWPLDIQVLALDISEASLRLYRDLLNTMAPELRESGMHITLNTRVCDLTMPGIVDQAVDTILVPAGEAPRLRLLAVVSAISGMDETTHQAVSLTLTNLAARLSHRNAGWLWVEPSAAKRHPARTLSSLVDRLLRLLPPYGPIPLSETPIRFTDGIALQHSTIDWLDPFDAVGAPIRGSVCAMGARSSSHGQ